MRSDTQFVLAAMLALNANYTSQSWSEFLDELAAMKRTIKGGEVSFELHDAIGQWRELMEFRFCNDPELVSEVEAVFDRFRFDNHPTPR